MAVYDIKGREIEVLLDELKATGAHSLLWKADIPSGVYFINMVGVGVDMTQKIALVR